MLKELKEDVEKIKKTQYEQSISEEDGKYKKKPNRNSGSE